jgi:hypothetical protein
MFVLGIIFDATQRMAGFGIKCPNVSVSLCNFEVATKIG